MGLQHLGFYLNLNKLPVIASDMLHIYFSLMADKTVVLVAIFPAEMS